MAPGNIRGSGTREAALDQKVSEATNEDGADEHRRHEHPQNEPCFEATPAEACEEGGGVAEAEADADAEVAEHASHICWQNHLVHGVDLGDKHVCA